MALPPLDPDPRSFVACWCGNELPAEWLPIHQASAHPRGERAPDDFMAGGDSMPGGSDASFEKAKNDVRDFGQKVADARKDGKNAS